MKNKRMTEIRKKILQILSGYTFIEWWEWRWWCYVKESWLIFWTVMLGMRFGIRQGVLRRWWRAVVGSVRVRGKICVGSLTKMWSHSQIIPFSLSLSLLFFSSSMHSLLVPTKSIVFTLSQLFHLFFSSTSLSILLYFLNNFTSNPTSSTNIITTTFFIILISCLSLHHIKHHITTFFYFLFIPHQSYTDITPCIKFPFFFHLNQVQFIMQ